MRRAAATLWTRGPRRSRGFVSEREAKAVAADEAEIEPLGIVRALGASSHMLLCFIHCVLNYFLSFIIECADC